VGYDPDASWRAPGFEQGPRHPAVALSWDDAIRYCNWLSAREGLPPAYDVESGALLDRNGGATSDVFRVRGFRLPTEAEWEFAARERGRRVRFGNGQLVARSAEITFDAGVGDFPYLERGENPGRTAPVGSHPPNDLGLHDMSGNAWEWVHDPYAPYPDGAAETSPPVGNGDRRILRGGRWGGDASEARVFHRSSWLRNDRCNNSGFRVARSATMN
jgi:formylglycine-generating enzyme required for sulfatase activity